MYNLIVVSNREPYEHNVVDGRVVCQRTDGGLVSALDPVLTRLGGTWVAWGSGTADKEAQAKQMVSLFLLIRRPIDCSGSG
jgi:trehalose 6-phosphate synthase